MKITRFNESLEYYKELGYDMNMIDYLSSAYQLWTEAEGLPDLSADEQDTSKLNDKQIAYLDAFLQLWEITMNFEKKYYKSNFVPGKTLNKYNL